MIDKDRARELHDTFQQRAQSMTSSASKLPKNKRKGVIAEAKRNRDAAILMNVLIKSGLLAESKQGEE